MLNVQDISLQLNENAILSHISFCVARGETIGIIGPNGSGKSTLIKILSRLLTPDSGTVILDGKPLSAYSPKMLARRMAVVSQAGIAPLPITVEEAVAMGRYPYQRLWKRKHNQDEEVINRVMLQTGLQHMNAMKLDELSGGERQRVAVACSLAQEPEILLLDEPTTYLDIGYQIGILDLVRDWREKTGGTAILVLHDLNLAAQYCNRLLLMQHGKITHEGPVEQIVQAALLSDVYGIKPLVVEHPNLGIPQILLERSS
jgi:iron complex transport system ATP-binding protein